ncbi:unnamed protein product [Coffea canephora]|uniref:Uncharacterized protein n=1 Tax=Coffea canephora TaxID=49390 RepID=A0A068TV38_COFCA|nr:unnamed protein product [Coffea canephora]
MQAKRVTALATWCPKKGCSFFVPRGSPVGRSHELLPPKDWMSQNVLCKELHLAVKLNSFRKKP